MIPVDQSQFAGEGAGGNCVQAAVASILELPLSDVPHFLEIAEKPEWWGMAFEDWMEVRGIHVWNKRGHLEFEGFYLASGPAVRGAHHMCVYRDGKLEHDPHPSRAGLIDVEWTRVLVPLSPAEIKAKGA